MERVEARKTPIRAIITTTIIARTTTTAAARTAILTTATITIQSFKILLMVSENFMKFTR